MSYTKTIYRRHLQAHDYDTGAHKYLKVVDKKATGTDAGGSSAATWNVRELVEITDNAIHATNVSLDSNTLTLPAGTYYCRISAPASGSVGANQLKVVNTAPDTDVDLVYGAVEEGAGRAEVVGKFVLEDVGTIQVQHYTTSAVAASGLGAAGSIGGDEIYTIAEFWMEQDPTANAEI